MTDYHFGPLFRLIDTAIYMESGYIYTLPGGFCAIEIGRPADLNYSVPVNSYVTSKTTPLQGQVFISDDVELELDEAPFTGQAIAAGDKSRAVGCSPSQKTASFTDQCGNNYVIEEELAATEGFCPLSTLVNKKKTIAMLPPSLFSGKLRLMVQAVYGSKRTDMAFVEVGGFIIPGKLSLAGFELHAFYQPSHGLFTTSDYDYYLIEITDVIKYYPLALSGIGRRFRDILKDHPRNNEPAFVKKIEAYILATATIDSANVITGGDMSSVSGIPLAYGWHWSWNGSEGDIVTHTENFVQHYYDVKRYHLAIQYSEGVFTETLSIIETGYWFPQPGSGINVFFPNYWINKAQVMPIVDGLPNGIPVPLTVGSAPLSPLHCFRSMSDALTVVKYSSNIYYSNSYIAEDGDPVGSDEDRLIGRIVDLEGIQGTTSLMIGDAVHTGTAITFDSRVQQQSFPEGAPILAGYYSGNITVPVLGLYVVGGQSYQDYLIGTGYFQIVSGEGLVPAQSPGPGFVYGIKMINQSRSHIDEQAGPSTIMNTELFLQLPFNDCTAVLWGYRDITVKNNVRTSAPAYRTYHGGVAVWKFSVDGGVTTPVSEVLEPVPGSIHYTLEYVTNWGPYNNISIKTGYARLFVYDGTSTDNIEIYSETNDNPMGSYFEVDYADYPYVDQIDRVWSDTSGGYRYTYKSIISDDAKHPGDSAVGWA